MENKSNNSFWGYDFRLQVVPRRMQDERGLGRQAKMFLPNLTML
jgi:hypothetical protein